MNKLFRAGLYLEETYTGESTASKLKRVRERMEKENTGYHLLTSLDDIDWLLNVRGQDVEYFPLLLSYALITMDSVELYADERKWGKLSTGSVSISFFSGDGSFAFGICQFICWNRISRWNIEK